LLELIKDILKTLKELGIMSFAITITTTILGVTTLMIGATTEPNAQAMTVMVVLTFRAAIQPVGLHFVSIDLILITFGKRFIS
jgi:hypothetical protein